MDKKQFRTPVVYDSSRIRSPIGIAKMYLFYAYKVVRIIMIYLIKNHPKMSRREKLAKIKPLRVIISECWASWRKWREFPFPYFINYLWLESEERFSKVEDFVPLIKHEVQRDRQVTLRSKQVLSSKVFMSKFMFACNIAQATPVIYAESGRIISSQNRILTDQRDLSETLNQTTSEKLFLKYDICYGGLGIDCFSMCDGVYRNSDGNIFDFRYLEEKAIEADFVCQEGLQQIAELAALNKDSVNTLRIMTRFRSDKVEVVAAVLRVGRKGSFVDNGTVGGLSCHVDLDNWTTSGTAVLWNSHPFQFYECHPDNGVSFDGIRLPFHEETFSLVKKTAVMFPGCEIIGWDICLTVDGPKIIEVNWNPDVDLPQMSGKVGRADIYF